MEKGKTEWNQLAAFLWLVEIFLAAYPVIMTIFMESAIRSQGIEQVAPKALSSVHGVFFSLLLLATTGIEVVKRKEFTFRSWEHFLPISATALGVFFLPALLAFVITHEGEKEFTDISVFMLVFSGVILFMCTLFRVPELRTRVSEERK
jgi:hypothetical protein